MNNKPEISKILTVSTGHIAQGTLELLEQEPEANNMGLSVYQKGEFGYFIYLPDPHDASANRTSPGGRTQFGFDGAVPDDLQKILQYCQDLGCSVLCFDCDAERIPYLPWYYPENVETPGDALDTTIEDSDIPSSIVKRLAAAFEGTTTTLRQVHEAGKKEIGRRTSLPKADMAILAKFFIDIGCELN